MTEPVSPSGGALRRAALALRSLLAFGFLVTSALAQGVDSKSPDFYRNERHAWGIPLGARFVAYDGTQLPALDQAIVSRAPSKGSLAYEKRWKTIWEAERSAVKMLQMAVLLPKGKWVPEDAEARILISTRRGQCPEESDLRDPKFHERLVAVLTSHHVVPGSGLSVEWDQELSFQHWGKVPIASLEGTVTRKDGTRIGVRYVFIPGGDRFFRVKAVAREPWRKEVFDTLDRMLEGFQGAKEYDGSSLKDGLLRGGLIGALLLLGVFLWQQRSARSAGRTSLKSPEASVR